MANYNWKRFWCPRGITINLGFGGYLSDPEGKHGDILNPDVNVLNRFGDKSFLALLGEPGMGKSHEFDNAVAEARRRAAVSGDLVKCFDLGICDSGQQLIDAVFAGLDVDAWAAGDKHYSIWLDSLDEGLIEVAKLQTVIARGLRMLQANAKRLRVRIACRTADFGSTVHAAANEIWEEPAIGTIELTPLRLSDVQLAAKAEGISPDDFTSAVALLGLESFAMTPVTLKMLLDSYKEEGQLPKSRAELYRRGCRRLATELNPSRQDARQTGNLTPEQRVRIAERIAYLMIFGGKSSITTDVSGEPETMQLALSDISGGSESLKEDVVRITESAACEVIGTGLFSARSASGLGFAHQTYAEFLAAEYLRHSNFSVQQRRSLLFHPDASQRVAPQLAEVAGWHGSDSTEIQNLLLAGDPQIFLRCDSTRLSDETKEAIIDRLITGFNSESIDDSDWASRWDYHKLNHAKLDGQILPILSDRNRAFLTRRFAFDLAKQCPSERLRDDLLRVVLDTDELPGIRYLAVEAFIATKPADDAIVALRPLTAGSVEDDPEDDLRGVALSEFWSRGLISAANLFDDLLVEPNRETYGGEYSHFLLQVLREHLAPADIPIALGWVKQNIQMRGRTHLFDYVIENIIQFAAERLDCDENLNAMASVIHEGLEPRNQRVPNASVVNQLDNSVRRRLALKVGDLITEPNEDRFKWSIMCHQLILKSDLDWLMEAIKKCDDPGRQERLAMILRELCSQLNHREMDSVVQLSMDEPVVGEVFSEWFSAIDIHSPIADRLRQSHHNEHRLQQQERAITRRGERWKAAQIPKESIEEMLARFEVGDLNAWWHLTKTFAQRYPDMTPDVETQDDLTTYEAWRELPEKSKSRMVDAAEQYLRHWRAKPREWINGKSIHFPDQAAYRAVVILDRLRPAAIDSIPSDRWADLAYCLLGQSDDFNEESVGLERQRRLLKTAYSNAPKSFTTCVASFIEALNRPGRRGEEWLLGRLSLCWDADLVSTVASRIRKGFCPGTTLCRRQQQQSSKRRLLNRQGKHRQRQAAFGRRPPQRALTNQTRNTSSNSLLRPALMESLLAICVFHGSIRAAAFCRQLLRDRRWRPTLAQAAARVLWRNEEGRDFNNLMRVFERDNEFARVIISDLSHGYGFSHSTPKDLSPDKLAQLYRLIVDLYPPADDPKPDGPHQVTSREQVGHFRDSLVQTLCDSGSLQACEEIAKLVRDYPEIARLRWQFRSAKRNFLQSSWRPLSIPSLHEIRRQTESRLVRTDNELQRVVLESLQRLQSHFSGPTPAARDVWDYQRNRKAWTPIGENELSDYIVRYLRQDLESLGIVSLREVEVRQGPRGKGERTDIYVVTTVGDQPGRRTTSKIVIEVKGCWHGELWIAMETQLRDRYMRQSSFTHGIYLVGWFLCDEWLQSDSRYKNTDKKDISEVSTLLSEQAEQLTSDDAKLDSFVLALPVAGVPTPPV
ncbi:NACHT domain-containing protein [Roseimaritima ulvae]|uniref:Uncharacterized protein n=1 Tax=Roseimaritima ulvae TaxID=980254 RepID=A0A5B9QQF5_9BACT|nr:hypothetical protein [Roseimaritima ulvae]QEG41238.1 hypothetical protein UC8_32570 [Roseimaritima ulvae]